MFWDSSYYVKYTQAGAYLKQMLGLSMLDNWKERDVLTPYYYYIVSYVNARLINLGTDDLKSMIEEVFNIFEYGADMIIAERTRELAHEIGLLSKIDGTYVPDHERPPSEEIEDDSGILPDVDYLDIETGEDMGEIGYKQEYFIFCWADFMSTLCMRLRFQYAYLFAQEPDGECCKCGARGQTESDYESWQSGVYPEDECYDRTNYYRSNSAWGINKDRFCECYKHRDQN